jgi:hypothetical protein
VVDLYEIEQMRKLHESYVETIAAPVFTNPLTKDTVKKELFTKRPQANKGAALQRKAAVANVVAAENQGFD